MSLNIQSFDSFSRPTLTAALALSFPVTVLAGVNTRLALAISGNKDTINTQSIPQYGGVAMTAVAAADSTNTLTIATRWYVLDAPAVGTANITITNPGNTNNCAYFWIVVDNALAGSAGSIGGYVVTATSTPVTATVGANDLAIVAAVFLAGNPSTVAAGTTSIGAASIDTAQGGAAKGWAGYKLGGNPSINHASGQLAWATLVIPGAAASPGITLTGPSSGATGVASTNFTVGATATISGSHVVTPSDGGAGGTFTPSTVTISSGSPTGTFTYTPSSAGVKTISATDAGGYTAPASLTYTATSTATTLTLSGPSGGVTGAASTNFTVGANGTISGAHTVTPSDGGAGGTFSPTTVAISSGTPTATFTYTPSSVGAKSISVSDSGGYAAPTSLTYTATAAGATALTLSGPTGGAAGVASTNFTVGANGAISGSHVVTPSDGGAGGSFSPATVTISSGSPTGTFTYTPSSAGAKSISATDAGGLTAPSALTYTATAAAGTFTSEPLKTKAGLLLASKSLVYYALYNDTTGALVVRKTGLSTNASGVVSFTDAAIVSGVTYKSDWMTTEGHYRMPSKAAA